MRVIVLRIGNDINKKGVMIEDVITFLTDKGIERERNIQQMFIERRTERNEWILRGKERMMIKNEIIFALRWVINWTGKVQQYERIESSKLYWNIFLLKSNFDIFYFLQKRSFLLG